MTEPRAPRESEVPHLIGFLDQHLRPEMGWSIATEYPLVFSPNNLENLRIIADGDRVLAHAAVRYFIIKSTAGLFKVAAIGSVLTDPQFRNQGLSQEILQSALQSAQLEGADFAILWTDLYDFYRKFGFELAGSEINLVINGVPRDIFANAINKLQNRPGVRPYRNDLKFLKSEKVSPDAMLKLYSQHTCTTIRTVEHVRRYLQIPNSRIYTAWGPDNRILAYAVEGKGADLKGYVHEWGGNIECLMPLFAHMFEQNNGPLTIMTPAHSENLRVHLRTWSISEHRGFLGMIQPVSVEPFFTKIKRHARNHGIADLVLEKCTEGFRVGRGNDVVILNSVQELTRLIFGPHEDGALKDEFGKVFPIPMWIWGWDSI